MKPGTFRLVAASAFLALIGVIVTQSFWVLNAMKHKEEQFNAKTRVALKTVVNQLFDLKTDSTQGLILFCNEPCAITQRSILTPEFAAAMDSLILNEFRCMKISRDYIYGVYDKEGRLFSGKSSHPDSLIAKSQHSISLSCIHRQGGLNLGVYFFNQKSFILGQIMGWILLSVLFTAIVVISFVITILSFLRQKKLSDMKNDFVGNMTHEFKTPISTISLASEMLIKPQVMSDKEKVQKYAALIYNENTRLKNQVDHVLQVTAFDQGRIKLDSEKMNIAEMLRTQAEVFDMYAREKGGRVVLSDLPSEIWVRADRIHITSVLSNLLENAVKYCHQKPDIQVHLKGIFSVSRPGYLVTVSDNGPGIPYEYQKMVFKRFFRVPTGNRHDVKGFGLGLYYVKTVVEAHQGYVSLESHPGKGSKFSFFLPGSEKKGSYDE